mmetsp:Transcript_16683/g.32252  ORF Transcript_16683/g.32252 Transcript_16683/m.32252 type:complete len:216 (-) Transcript_16683:955-1602(-)
MSSILLVSSPSYSSTRKLAFLGRLLRFASNTPSAVSCSLLTLTRTAPMAPACTVYVWGTPRVTASSPRVAPCSRVEIMPVCSVGISPALYLQVSTSTSSRCSTMYTWSIVGWSTSSAPRVCTCTSPTSSEIWRSVKGVSTSIMRSSDQRITSSKWPTSSTKVLRSMYHSSQSVWHCTLITYISEWRSARPPKEQPACSVCTTVFLRSLYICSVPF